MKQPSHPYNLWRVLISWPLNTYFKKSDLSKIEGFSF